MPTYTYQCENGHEFDKITSVAEHSREAVCPSCEAEAIQVIKQINIDSYFDGSVKADHRIRF